MRQHAGFTIIELMIGLTLGLLLTMAVANVYANMQKTNKTQAAFNQMSDDGRFVLETYKRLINQAGFRPTNLLNTNFTASGTLFAANQVIGVATAATNTPLLTRFYGDASNNIIRCDKTADTNYPYLIDPATIYSFGLSWDSTARNLHCGLPAASGALTTASDQILADNVVDYSLLFGVDTDSIPDQIPDTYISAPTSTQWPTVYTARLCFVLKSSNLTLLKTPMDYQKCDGTVSLGSAAARSNDGAVYRTFTSTIVLRNHFG